MSKKTEVKDIKWANEEIKKEWNLLNDKRYEREVDDLTTGVLLGLKKALNILDKLDEPEVVPNEVEEEQKYHVRDKHGVYLLAKNQQADGRVETVADIVEFYGVEEVELDYELTEQEIKDYDERYWVFAKPVEELE